MGYLTHRNTSQDNIISLLGSVALPAILGAVTFGLKKLISKWLDDSYCHDIGQNIGEQSHDEYGLGVESLQDETLLTP